MRASKIVIVTACGCRRHLPQIEGDFPDTIRVPLQVALNWRQNSNLTNVPPTAEVPGYREFEHSGQYEAGSDGESWAIYQEVVVDLPRKVRDRKRFYHTDFAHPTDKEER